MVPTVQLNAEAILGAAAFIVALFFGYFPVVRVKFAGLSSEAKSGIMIGILALITIIIVLLGCNGGLVVTGLVCTPFWPMFWSVLWTFGQAVAINQGTNRIFPELNDVKVAKAARVK